MRDEARGVAPALRHPDVRATPFALRHPPTCMFALVRGGLQPSLLFAPPLHTADTRYRPRWPFPTTRSSRRRRHRQRLSLCVSQAAQPVDRPRE